MHFFFFRALITKQVEWKLQEAERWTVLLIPLSLEWYLGLEMLKHFFLPDCPINTSIRMILHSSGPTCLFLHLFVGSASAFQTRPCLRITWGGEGRLLKHRSMAHNLSFCFRRHGGGLQMLRPNKVQGAAGAVIQVPHFWNMRKIHVSCPLQPCRSFTPSLPDPIALFAVACSITESQQDWLCALLEGPSCEMQHLRLKASTSLLLGFCAVVDRLS